MLDIYFAHAGEEHAEAAATVSHWLESSTNAILAWVLLGIISLYVLPRFLKVSKSSALLVFSAINFAYGIYLYDKSPKIGAVVLTIGFITTLLSVINGLGLNEKGNKHGRRK